MAMMHPPHNGATCEAPLAGVTTMIQREVTRAGGRVHDIVHTDRSYQLQQPTKFGSQRTVAIEKCTCGLAKVLVDVPYTKANGFASTEGARLCIVCDALDQTPRFHQ